MAKQKAQKAQLGLDTEYDALRRRMSRVRVKEGQKPTADDMDIVEEEDDAEDFTDLIKFWKKHNVGFAKEMMKMVESNKAKKTSKGRGGRRKSIEFEDLEQTSSGQLSLPAHMSPNRQVIKKGISEEITGEESGDVSSATKPRKPLSQKQRSFTTGRTNSKTNVVPGESGTSRTNGQTRKHVFRRADSESMVTKLSSNPRLHVARERIVSESSSTVSVKSVKKK